MDPRVHCFSFNPYVWSFSFSFFIRFFIWCTIFPQVYPFNSPIRQEFICLGFASRNGRLRIWRGFIHLYTMHVLYHCWRKFNSFRWWWLIFLSTFWSENMRQMICRLMGPGSPWSLVILWQTHNIICVKCLRNTFHL